jgi:cyclic pyranopterin phosphate synthase
MYDRYNRHINYLRISVTDRCNLRCKYCMPESGITMLRHEDILSFEEIEKVVKVAVSMGIDKVRITGGEPLVRKGISDLVKMLAAIDGIRDLALTTNGQLLETYAKSLAEAGLHRVNISLDTVDEDHYRTLTRGGDIRNVVRGIIAAKKAGLSPIKLNCVIEKSSEEPDALGVAYFATQMGLEIRYIKKMDLHSGSFSIVEGGTGGDCKKCNRLRLTADGKIRPCLFSDLEYDVRILGAEEALKQALENKPEKGKKNDTGEFYNIGG